jgi:hypothetical protein
MTITITLPEAIDIDSYGGLQAFLIRHLQLSDDAIERIQTLIRLGEVRLARMLTTPAMETSDTLVTVAGAQTVALPADMELPQQLRIVGGAVLAQTALDTVEAYNADTGRPIMWAPHGGAAVLAPVPDTVYTLSLRYMSRLPFLNDNATSNWLLARHPDAYVYMCSAVICQHLGDMESAGMYLAQANAVIDEINTRAVRMKYGDNLTPRNIGTP